MPSNFRRILQASTVDAGTSFLRKVKLDDGVSPAILLVEKMAMLLNVTKCVEGKEMFVRKVTYQQMFSLFGLMFGLGCHVMKGKLCVSVPLRTQKSLYDRQMPGCWVLLKA